QSASERSGRLRFFQPCHAGEFRVRLLPTSTFCWKLDHCWLCRFPGYKLLQDSCRNRVEVLEMLLLAKFPEVSVRGHDSRRLVLKGYGKIGCVEAVVVEFSC